MTRVDLDGLGWEVRLRGSGSPLLLLHGFTGRGSGWGALATAWARHYQVVVVDLPGHGRSGIPADPARASVERTADDLATILARARAAPAHVLGYSLGARIALRLAVAHGESVRRLILESPSAGIERLSDRAARQTADEGRAARLEQHGIGPFVDEWEREPVFASQAGLAPERAARLRAERLRNRPAGLATSLRAAGQGAMEPLFDRLAGIRAPTLVIAGALDPAGRARAEGVAAAIPGAILEVIPNAGHAAHLETPATVRSLVLAFLKEESAA